MARWSQYGNSRPFRGTPEHVPQNICARGPDFLLGVLLFLGGLGLQLALFSGLCLPGGRLCLCLCRLLCVDLGQCAAVCSVGVGATSFVY